MLIGDTLWSWYFSSLFIPLSLLSYLFLFPIGPPFTLKPFPHPEFAYEEACDTCQSGMFCLTRWPPVLFTFQNGCGHCICFSWWLNNTPLCICAPFSWSIPLLVGTWVDQSWAVANSVPISITMVIQVLTTDFIVCRYIPKSSIVGRCGSSDFSFLKPNHRGHRNLHTH